MNTSRTTTQKRMVGSVCRVFLGAMLILGLAIEYTEAYAKPFSGTIRGGTYTNPSRTFRIKVPPLLQPGGVVIDQSPIDGVWLVEFIDDKCRNYIVTERYMKVPTENLREWLSRNVTTKLKQSGARNIKVTVADTKLGRGFRLFYEHPRTGPCKVYQKENTRIVQTGGYPPEVEQQMIAEGWRVSQPDAIVGMQIVITKERVFRFLYVVGKGETEAAEWISPRAMPVKDLLMQFVNGFELLQ